jgi:uncharacterized protein (TIGR04255 family)
MSQIPFERFPRPPIKEAVFILNFQKPISIEKITLFSKDENISKKYPFSQVSIQNNLRINTKKDFSSTSFQKLQDGLIFRTSEKNPEWVLQVKRNGILLHKVGNYSSWDNLVVELKDLILVFNKTIGSGIDIKDVGIRYINHIPISKTQSLRDWFKLLPPLIEEIPTKFNKFLLQLGVEENDLSGLIVESVLEINSILNFVIDLRVTKPLKNVNIKFENLEVPLNEVRDFKNKIFFSIITENIKPVFR